LRTSNASAFSVNLKSQGDRSTLRDYRGVSAPVKVVSFMRACILGCPAGFTAVTQTVPRLSLSSFRAQVA